MCYDQVLKKSLKKFPDPVCTIYSGVQVFGEGNWGKIFEAYEKKFHPSRTNISIKDRWRTMVKHDIHKHLSEDQRRKKADEESQESVDISW